MPPEDHLGSDANAVTPNRKSRASSKTKTPATTPGTAETRREHSSAAKTLSGTPGTSKNTVESSRSKFSDGTLSTSKISVGEVQAAGLGAPSATAATRIPLRESSDGMKNAANVVYPVIPAPPDAVDAASETSAVRTPSENGRSEERNWKRANEMTGDTAQPPAFGPESQSSMQAAAAVRHFQMQLGGRDKETSSMLLFANKGVVNVVVLAVGCKVKPVALATLSVIEHDDMILTR